MISQYFRISLTHSILINKLNLKLQKTNSLLLRIYDVLGKDSAEMVSTKRQTQQYLGALKIKVNKLR